MQVEENSYVGGDGRTLFYRCWDPAETAQAVLLVAHGAGEHSGRYQQLAEMFCGRSFAVVAPDHYGHGKSEGRPGFVADFNDYVVDLEALRCLAEERFKGLPMFLLGHSMGGLIAGNYLPEHQHRFAGCVLSGPLVYTGQQPGAAERFLIRVLAVLLPRLGVLGLDPANVSRDPDVVRRYAEDPLVFHGRMSVRMVRELFAGMDVLQRNARRISLPLLILHGADDVLTDPAGSQWLHSEVGSQDKALTVYPGLYHEIFNEPEGDAIIAEALSWCEARIPGQ